MLLLQTLGRLQLVEPDAPEVPLFTGPKPLMLLAYLAIEGPADRRHLAELFFSRHRDPLDNVSATLRRLRGADPSLIATAGSEVRTTVSCDYLELRKALHSNAQGQAASLYMGSFLRGCNLSTFGIEFEEWAYRLRSALAESLQNGLLQQAEALCTSLRFDEAGSLAERAYLLPGADEPDPEVLLRLHSIFAAANHPLEADVRAEALRFGLSELPAEQHPAMTGLHPGDDSAAQGNLPLPLDSFIGRDSEIAELLGLLRRNDVRLVTLQGPGEQASPSWLWRWCAS